MQMSVQPMFRAALGSWATGVSVVTVNDDGMLYGLTVSSFTSVSLSPPLVLVCIAKENRLPAMARRGGRFAVSLLASDQQEASRYFATPGRLPTEGFTVIGGLWTDHGVPVLDGALAWVACTLRSHHEEGDHDILVGEVVGASADEGRSPLLYWRRAYRSLATTP